MGWLCGPGSSSVDLAAPQQASEWMSRDDGFIDGQGQSPVPLGWREPNKSQPLLARVCLQTASYQQKKLSKLLFFPAKRIPPPPFFFFLLGSSNWELVHPCTSCADPCTLCTALGTELPTLILHVPASAAHAPPNQSPRAGLLPCEWKVVFEQWFRALVWIVLPTCRQNRAQTNLVSRHSVPIFYFFFSFENF